MPLDKCLQCLYILGHSIELCNLFGLGLLHKLYFLLDFGRHVFIIVQSEHVRLELLPMTHDDVEAVHLLGCLVFARVFLEGLLGLLIHCFVVEICSIKLIGIIQV